jgi:ABC-type phosphate transport system ATPase subunit
MGNNSDFGFCPGPVDGEGDELLRRAEGLAGRVPELTVDGLLACRHEAAHHDEDDEPDLGRLVEVGPTGHIFRNPEHQLTVDYITGRFG